MSESSAPSPASIGVIEFNATMVSLEILSNEGGRLVSVAVTVTVFVNEVPFIKQPTDTIELHGLCPVL